MINEQSNLFEPQLTDKEMTDTYVKVALERLTKYEAMSFAHAD